ncbi:MAG: aldo/keto reductase [Bacteroidetes bacterium]|nr:aldo/keto reductase [Bacteroidota bacterium]
MKKRKLGKTEIELSSIALGAWAIGGWMWGGNEKKDSIRAIHACQEQGITSIDTAPIYGFGFSEEIVGEAIGGKRDRYEILTKAGMSWENTKGVHYFTTRDNGGAIREVYKYSGKESVIAECEASLLRLGTDYIDLYQIHWPDVSTPIGETMEALQLLKDQGKIRAAGVSNYSLEQMQQASELLDLASNQLPYSMVRRDIEEGIVPWCVENECGILAYSPLQRGLLTGKMTPETNFAPGDSRSELSHFKMNNLIKTNDFLDNIRPLAEEKGKTLAQLVIRWTLQRPGISVALVGARNEAQVEQNAVAAQFSLSDEEMDQINASLEDLSLDPD